MKQTLKQKLQNIKYNESDNLYNHLVNVLRRMLLEAPHDAYSLFEQYSMSVGNKQLKQTKIIKQTYEQLKDYIDSMTKLLNKPSSGNQQEEAEEPVQQNDEPGPSTGYVPNILEQSRWFQMAGIGFGQELTYKIFKSLEKFSINKSIDQLKFWGKIYGQQRDYYIAQGKGPAQQVEGGQNAEAEQPPADIQPRGQQGINEKIYWVTTDLTKTWIQLPTVTPQQMIVSRKLKYIFTGNLQTQICRNPHFAGKQSHLLKCQILRITAGCTIIPRTLYKVQQQQPDSNDNAEITKQQEWKHPQFQFFTHLDNWVHFPPNILFNGRKTHLPPPPQPQDLQDENYQQNMKKLIRTKDPFDKRLKPIVQDKFNQIPGWKLNVYGDTNTYKPLAKDGQVNYGFVSIKSNIWKGYTHVYHNKQYSSIYIGSGFKSSSVLYFPCLPQQVLTERKDQNQQPQPNFIPQQQPKVQQGQQGAQQQQPAQQE